jgi:triphosphoribosyl-dephospho-CoA synthase
MTVLDFERSAEAAAAPLARRGAKVGRRILDAVAATLAAVATNTNLGIVLLCAPLAAAAERGGDLRGALQAVLRALDREDAALAFEAIRLAMPAGLGGAARHDVREAPSCTLREAMAEAAGRDRVAKAYLDGFEDVFAVGLAALAAATPAAPTRWWPAAAVYLRFLSAFPDTHIARKFGPARAEAVRREAAAFLAGIAETREPGRLVADLARLDRSLKENGLNPGTSADLTVATLFAGRLRGILRETRDSGSLKASGAGAPPLSGQPVRRVAGC